MSGYPPQDPHAPQGYGQQPGYAPYPQQPGDPQQYAGAYPQGYAQQYGQAGYTISYSNLPTECYGGFWLRFVAVIIDALVLMIPGFMIQFAIYTVMGEQLIKLNPNPRANPFAEMFTPAYFASIGASTLLILAYESIMNVKWGGTLGKLALSLRVVNADGMYLNWAQSIGRTVGKLAVHNVCALLQIIAGFHPRKQGLADLMASTYVLHLQFVNPYQLQMSQSGQS